MTRLLAYRLVWLALALTMLGILVATSYSTLTIATAAVAWLGGILTVLTYDDRSDR